MTAGDAWYGDETAVAEPAPRRRGRRGRPKPEKPVLWNGQPVRFRAVQMIIWGSAAAFLLGLVIAGLYFGLWEVHWYLPVGPEWLRRGFDLKAWWDAGSWWPSWLGHWPDYRHTAFRNQLEPQIATIGVMTLIAKQHWWSVRVRPARVVTGPFVMLAFVLALGILGVWLGDFELPSLWAHAAAHAGHKGFNLDGKFAWAGTLSLFTLAWGFGAGRLLRRYWAPIGSTLQGYQLERLADRARRLGRVPLWVRLPVIVPTVRERFSALYTKGATVQGSAGDKIAAQAAETAGAGHRALRIILAPTLLIVFWLIILGVIGKYWVGDLHHTVPYLAP